MKIARTRSELEFELKDKTVGFVPTMGSLHDGHLSLVAESKHRGLFTVVSIFVNPTQFNDPKDYDKYPIDIEGDTLKLEAAGCDVLFLPNKGVVYAAEVNPSRYIHDFGHLERVYEGAFRPGHFKGVGQVVHIFFELIKPTVAFFGEKDFQQLQVIKQLVNLIDANIEIVGMPTAREESGLAMSSRNKRLSKEDHAKASILYQSLVWAKDKLGEINQDAVKAEVAKRIEQTPNFRLEYFDIIESRTFQSVSDDEVHRADKMIIAAFCGEVRLIDNLAIL